MKRKMKYIKEPGKQLWLIAAAMLVLSHLSAQDRDKYDTIANRYKNEHAVYTNVTEQLVITEENGVLAANSYVTLEKLLLTDHALNTYNRDQFDYSDFHELTSCSGLAYLPSGYKTYRQVKCSGFGSGSPRSYVFFDDVRYVQSYYSGLLKNSITETKYSIEHTNMHMIPSFWFQDVNFGLPVASATYEVIAPAYVKMNFVIKGENTSKIKQTKEEKNGKIYYRFTATEIPAFKEYENVPSIHYYVPHVIPYIVSYRLDGAKKDSVLTNNADDLYKYLYPNVRNKNFKVDTFLTKKVDQITGDDVSVKDKAEHIYKWVMKNIHYVAIENGLEGFVPRPADTVLKRKYGDCKDMAAIIVTMCNMAGLEAHYAWVGTNRLPYEHNDLPLSLLFNHMICALKLNGQWIFLDGTTRLLPFGSNRYDIQGKEAMIAIDDNKYEVVKIPFEAADKNVTVDSTYISIEGKKITGSVKQFYKGYDAWKLCDMLQYTKKEDDREKAVRAITSRGSNKYIQSKYDIDASETGNRDVTIKADFVVDDYVHQAGKQCFVNLNLLRFYEDNAVNKKDRKVPAYFDYKNKHKEVVVLNLPKGYKVKSLPAPIKKSIDGVWNYSISYTADKNRIVLTKEYELNTTAIASDYFADHNKMVDVLKNIYKESVVLTAN